jgi:hypothetical protein
MLADYAGVPPSRVPLPEPIAQMEFAELLADYPGLRHALLGYKRRIEILERGLARSVPRLDNHDEVNLLSTGAIIRMDSEIKSISSRLQAAMPPAQSQVPAQPHSSTRVPLRR